MKSYRIIIAIAASAACHAAVLLPASSYRPAMVTPRRGDNAVTLELLESVEAVARSVPEPTRPVTEAKQAIQRQVQETTDRLAAMVRQISNIKLPDPPTPPMPEPPPKPVIAPMIQTAKVKLQQSTKDIAEQIHISAESLQQATRQCVAQAAAQQAAAEEARRAEQARQAAELAKATPPPKQARPDGNAAVNSRAADGASGTRGVKTDAQPIGDMRPSYPPACKRRNEEGIVTLEWQVLANGKCGWVRIVKSSGNGTLDQAAVDTVKEASFRPAVSAGVAVDSVMEKAFRFRIIEREY